MAAQHNFYSMKFYGIYKITNLLNGKMYIGQHTTENLDDGYMGSGRIIKYAITKYGKENFRKEWLMFCEDKEELNYMERVYVDQTWVDRADTYNLQTGGDHRVLSEESRRKMGEGVSRALKGRKLSEEHKRNLSASLKGWHQSEESNRKNSEWHKGRHPSEETRQKLKETHTGEKNYLYGKHLTTETRRKISDALSGEQHPNYGKHLSDETKRKISESKRRKKRSV